MKHIGLFEGIGGFSLAGRWAGWETVAWCEWDKKCQRVLKHHFPNADAHGDITKSDFSKYAHKADIVTAGFPCQPFSTAGKRLGSDDDRHLWPATLRAVKQIQPRVCVFENVFGLTSILEQACETDVEVEAVQLFSEGDDSAEVGERIREVKQRTISIIVNDVRQAGYSLPETSTGEAIVLCIPACAVNAPHRRDRIWFVAFKNTDQVRCNGVKPEGQSSEREQWELGTGDDVQLSVTPHSEESGAGEFNRRAFAGIEVRAENDASRCNDIGPTSHPEQIGQPGQGRAVGQLRTKEDSEWKASWSYNDGRWPTQSPVCGRNDGLPGGLVGITFPKWREFAIGAFGNAIVPQVAFEIFKAINEYEKLNAQ